MRQEFNKYFIQNQKSAYEMVKEFVDWEENKLKEDNNMKDGNKTVVELIADLQNQLDNANNLIKELIAENNELKNKYDKEKEKHQRATAKITHLKEESNAQYSTIDYLEDELIAEKVKNNSLKKLIDELKKNHEDELARSDKRSQDNIDSQLYSYWRLKEYHKEAKSNKNEMKHAKDYGWFQYDSFKVFSYDNGKREGKE